MRNRRLHGSPRGWPHPDRGPSAPRVPRLRLGRDRPRGRVGRDVRREAGRQARQPADGARGPDSPRRARPGAHPLGDPRATQRPQRPPAPGLHRRHHGDPQRDHRELPGAPGRARGPRPHAHLRDGHGGHRPPRGGGLPGRPRRGRPHRASAHRGRLRAGGDAPERDQPPRRGPPERPARGRAQRRGELHRQRRRRDPRPHQPHRVPRGGRRGGRAADGCRGHGSRRTPDGAPGDDHRLVARGRREGRLRALHAQGDPRAARRPAPVAGRAGHARRDTSTPRRSTASRTSSAG